MQSWSGSSPPEAVSLLSPEAFRALLASAPPVDDELLSDLREIRGEAGAPESRWPS